MQTRIRASLFIALFACCANAAPLRMLTASAGAATSEEMGLFGSFKLQFNKHYFDQHDEEYRMNVFIQNLRMIRAHNSGNHSYSMAMNEFGDLTFEEFRATHVSKNGDRSKYLRSHPTATLPKSQLPDSVDWSATGAISPVQNEGQCGACYAFTTTSAIEAAVFIATGNLVPLSAQEIVDCSGPEGAEGCNGGWTDSAFQYVVLNGICSAATYGYVGQQGDCKNTTCTKAARLSSYVDVPQTEDDLKAAVANQPVASVIEVDQPAFQFYSGGVLTGACGTNVDQALLVVGYGNLEGVDYWKLKNSWGVSWGLHGYVLIERGVNECGVHEAASYPVV